MTDILEVTDSTFEVEILKSDKPVMVDFWADWCMPCKMLAPTVDKIAKDYKDKLKVCKINVDSNQEVAASMGIRSIPTLIFFKNGEVVEQVIGVVNEAQLKKIVDKVIS